MKEVKKIKCKSCGSINLLGTKQCVKCKKKLEQSTKSCPKCAKKNDLEVKTCVTCGYRFDKQNMFKKNVFFSLLFSIGLVVLLVIMVFLNKKGLVNHIHFCFKVLSCFLILGIIYSTFNYGRKDIVCYNQENEMIKEDDRIRKLKKISNVVVIFGGILILGLLWYFLF